MRTLIWAMILASGPALGAVKIERDGKQTTYREESSGEHAGKASDKLRAYVLHGKIEETGKKTCDQLFEEFHELAIGDGEPRRIDVIGLIDCSATKERGPAKDFFFTYAFEPRSEADIPLLEAFLKEHGGRKIRGAKLVYRKAFGVLVQSAVDFYDEAVMDEPGDVFDTFYRDRMFTNWRQAETWVLAAADQVEAKTLDKLVQWIKDESDLDTAKYYFETVLPDTKMIKGTADLIYVLEDREVVRAPLNFTMGIRDSRKMSTGKSI